MFHKQNSKPILRWRDINEAKDDEMSIDTRCKYTKNLKITKRSILMRVVKFNSISRENKVIAFDHLSKLYFADNHNCFALTLKTIQCTIFKMTVLLSYRFVLRI